MKWIFPQAERNWGQVRKVEFVRQEPKKHKLSDRSLRLDIPILFSFENQQLLLWLVEFQEDKAKFSIYKLLRYTTDLMEAHPDALVRDFTEKILPFINKTHLSIFRPVGLAISG